MSFFAAIERAMLIVERIAAVMLGVITLLIVVSAIGRYLVAVPVPDAFDVSRLLIGAAIMWGFASVGYRGSHIKVDLFAEILSPRVRRITDSLAWAVLLGFAILLAWKMNDRMLSALKSGEATFDLRLPAWPFLALIVAGAAVSIVTIAARLLIVATGRGGLEGFEPVDMQPEAGRRDVQG
jgi:C4-dicarboxylate transporter DctQ subunit